MDKLRFTQKYNYSLEELAQIGGDGKKVKVGNQMLDIDALADLEGGKPYVRVGNKDISLEGIYNPASPKIYYTTTNGKELRHIPMDGWSLEGNVKVIKKKYGEITFDSDPVLIPIMAFESDSINSMFLPHLTSISFPDTVQYISSYALQNSYLTAFELPAEIKGISFGIFRGSRYLEELSVNSGSTVYDSRNNCNAIIETATNTLMQGCKTTVIPDDIVEIGECAFDNMDVSGITSLPEGAKYIRSGAFAGNPMTAFTLPSTIEIIGSSAFKNCEHIESFNFNGTVAQWNAVHKAPSWNLSCYFPTVHCTDGDVPANGGEELLYISSYSPYIAEAAEIWGDATLLSNEIWSEVREGVHYGDYCKLIFDVPPTEIPTHCFLSHVTEISIPDSVVKLNDRCFEDVLASFTVEIPGSVEYIGEKAFNNCRTLTSVLYKGTQAEWAQIELAENWREGSAIINIVCNDGTIKYE